ncbi:MAG: hypothetical protein PHS96_15140 [Anaerolineales bacterium]|nr:hypothetical protein [Anaerolineales bacterium]
MPRLIPQGLHKLDGRMCEPFDLLTGSPRITALSAPAWIKPKAYQEIRETVPKRKVAGFSSVFSLLQGGSV